MWGPGPWMGPMWGFWWIFPVIGLLIFLFFVVSVVRMIAWRGPFHVHGAASPRQRRNNSASPGARRAA